MTPKSGTAGKTTQAKTLIGLATAIRANTLTDTATEPSPAQADVDLKKKLNELKVMDLAAHNNHHEETNM